MMRLTITYTTSAPSGTLYEHQTVLDRPRLLTCRGALRVLRRSGIAAIAVVRVDGMSYGR